MLAKLTSKNQLTLPKSVTDRLGPVQYFEVQLQAGQVLLTPVRIQRGDAVRAKLAELDLGEDVIARALDAARKPARKATGKSTAPAGRKASPVKTRTPAKAGVAVVDKSVGKRVGKLVDKSAGKKAAVKQAAEPSKAARKAPPTKTSRRKSASAA